MDGNLQTLIKLPAEIPMFNLHAAFYFKMYRDFLFSPKRCSCTLQVKMELKIHIFKGGKVLHCLTERGLFTILDNGHFSSPKNVIVDIKCFFPMSVSFVSYDILS